MHSTTASRAETVDCGAPYETNRHKLLSLMRGLSRNELERYVPATPDWRIRDVLSHVVGITADLNALNFATGTTDEWTAAQVDARRSMDIEETIAEWDREAPRFEEGLRLLGYEVVNHFVADLHAHLQDVRQALALSADRDEPTVSDRWR